MTLEERLASLFDKGYDLGKEIGFEQGHAAGYKKAQDELEPMMQKLNEILTKVENYKEEKPWSPVPDATDV